MIELIYNEEEKDTEEDADFTGPKNVKQIGEPKEYKKIFIEDYVYTFLHRYSTGKEFETKIAILLGTSQRVGGKRHLYIKGALPVEGVPEKQGKYFFSEKLWGDIYRQCEAYFPDQEIGGWFLSKPGFRVEKNSVIEETHRTFFSGADKVLFMMEPLEEDSGFFCFDGNRFAKQPGYYIYYEKNESMQRFMQEKNIAEEKPVSEERTDVAMANFRKILQEKQVQNVRRRKLAMSYGMKVAAVLVFFAGAVTLKNQTDRIKAMEQQMDGVSETDSSQAVSSEEVIVEELAGQVEEQPEPVEEPVSEKQPEEELPVTESQSQGSEPIQEQPEEQAGEPVQEQPTEQAGEPVQEQSPEPAEEQPSEEAAAEAPVYEEYVVQPGDSLAKISRDKYGNDQMVKEICALNGIENGDYIQVGEKILLP